MARWLSLIFLAIAGYTLSAPLFAAQDNEAPPNVLLIVLDDFGYNDLGANGNPDTPTPTLDALAAQGTRYTRHYADSTCSVARAALLTGAFAARHGLRPAHLGLSQGTPTIASSLQQAGYRTQHIGKWHVANATLAQAPDHFGFDDWFGFLFQSELGGPSSDGLHYEQPTYNDPWLRENQSPLKQHSGHLTDILTRRAIEFLEQQQGQQQPWFLNLWYFAPHVPVHPADSFRSKYPATREGQYHALIDQLDTNIGKLLAGLDRNGQSDNSLVIVLSDNGGTNNYTDNNHPFYGKKAQFFEGGVRTPLLIRWPGHVAAETVSNDLVSIHDIFPTIAHAGRAPIPAAVIGRNLLSDQLAAPSQLYWEYSDSRTHSYSALSADGRWRLTRGSYQLPILNDLVSDPAGEKNAIEEHVQIASNLNNDYLQWRLAQRVVDFSYEPLGASGAAILRDNDLQRSPGYAGFTFAIGVTPSNEGRDTPQVIAEQAGRWRIETSSETGLIVDILGNTMVAPALPTGSCSELLISSHFKISPLNPERNWAIAEVFVNGTKTGGFTLDNPPLQTQGYDNPTYIGSSPAGEKHFSGTLSKPLILNERVVYDYLSGFTANGISGVASGCPS